MIPVYENFNLPNFELVGQSRQRQENRNISETENANLSSSIKNIITGEIREFKVITNSLGFEALLNFYNEILDSGTNKFILNVKLSDDSIVKRSAFFLETFKSIHHSNSIITVTNSIRIFEPSQSDLSNEIIGTYTNFNDGVTVQDVVNNFVELSENFGVI